MKSKSIRVSILTADLVCIVLALLTASLLRYGNHSNAWSSTPVHASLPLLTIVSLATWFVLYQVMDLDCFRHGWQTSAMVSRTTLGVLFHFVIVSSWGYFARLYYSRFILLFYLVVLWIGITTIRFAVYGLLRLQTSSGKAQRVVVIGDHRLSREIARRIARHPELLYNVVGFLEPFAGGLQVEGGKSSSSHLVTSLDAVDFLSQMNVREVIASVKYAPGLEMQNFIARCQEQGIHVHILPEPYELYVSRPRLLEVDGIPLLSLDRPHFSTSAAIAKRAFDLTAAALLSIPAAVILGCVGGMLWLRERRFLRREIRCGQNGREFAMLRLDIGLDQQESSRFHKLLRHLSVSELPQILNVLRGEMSLVGPRPERPERVRDYSDWERQRLTVLPGMTGLAQVNGLREHSSSDEKTHYDLQYMLHWTPLLDLVFLVQTIWTLMGRLVSERSQSTLSLCARDAKSQERARTAVQSS